MNRVAQKGNAFLKALSQDKDYSMDDVNAMMVLIKTHVSEQLANDMFQTLLEQAFDESEIQKLQIIAIGDKFIDAIKQVRYVTGYGLKEAKDICDRVRGGNPQTIDIPKHLSVSVVKQNFTIIGATVDCL